MRRGIDQVVRGESHGDPDMSDPEFGLGPNGPKLSGRGGGIGSAPLGPKMRLVDITADGMARTSALLTTSVVLGHKHAARQFIKQAGSGVVLENSSVT